MLVDSPSDVIMDIFSSSFAYKEPRSSKKVKSEELNLPPTEKEKIIGFLGSRQLIWTTSGKNDMKISETIHVLNELINKNLVECIEQSYYVLK